MLDTTFRTAQTNQETPQTPEKPAEVTGIVADPESVPREIATDTLEKWEVQHGKYGLEYFGIKNIAHTFPLSMQFNQIDKFIKTELAERGLDATPQSWQNILAEIEGEVGKEKDAYKRLQKLSDYLKVLSRMKALKKLKEKYLVV
jgi:poly(3-hydroxybutyrate) depolymerase